MFLHFIGHYFIFVLLIRGLTILWNRYHEAKMKWRRKQQQQ